jgi:HD-GYP domain-containing protein (c-di-GMP phosphodiesterase class II)
MTGEGVGPNHSGSHAQTTAAAPRPTPVAGPSVEAGGDAYIRRAGKGLILALYAALRAIRLYPLENAAVQNAAEELSSLTKDMLGREQELEMRLSGEFVFLNTVRLRLDLDNYASFSHLLSVFRATGVGSLHLHQAPTLKEWQRFLALLNQPSTQPPATRFEQLSAKLEQQELGVFEIGEPMAQRENELDREKSKEVAKKTYAQSVAVTKDLMTSVRLGRSPNLKKIKRVVQGIVDQILNEETSLIGLTTIRDYDEYTFTHSVNVCIFSVALGKRLGLGKVQLYDLGMAALFHDIGKSRVPAEIINKAGALTDDEWRFIAAHPWLGALALFQLRGHQELPYRAIVVAHEHHMKTDLTGYPRPIRDRKLSMFSKIVAVADGFDAATSRRSYQTTPLTPAQVMMEMRDNPRRGMDPVVVKAFINLTGVYPVGTLVILDTFELGIVHAVNPNAEMLSRPIVRIISDQQGNLMHPGTLSDLSEQNAEGVFLRTIIKTENPERYGIRVGDYFI